MKYQATSGLNVMQRTDMLQESSSAEERRRLPRCSIQCPARISIGARQYAGYIQDISIRGAKLRTITPIHRPGSVILTLPDLPPIRCELKWGDRFNAGVEFSVPLSPKALADWTASRTPGAMHRMAQLAVSNASSPTSKESSVVGLAAHPSRRGR